MAYTLDWIFRPKKNHSHQINIQSSVNLTCIFGEGTQALGDIAKSMTLNIRSNVKADMSESLILCQLQQPAVRCNEEAQYALRSPADHNFNDRMQIEQSPLSCYVQDIHKDGTPSKIQCKILTTVSYKIQSNLIFRP